MLCYYNDRHYLKPLLLGIEWPGERGIIGDLGLGNITSRVVFKKW